MAVDCAHICAISGLAILPIILYTARSCNRGVQKTCEEEKMHTTNHSVASNITYHEFFTLSQHLKIFKVCAMNNSSLSVSVSPIDKQQTQDLNHDDIRNDFETRLPVVLKWMARCNKASFDGSLTEHIMANCVT
jgi:hypothetical protein